MVLDDGQKLQHSTRTDIDVLRPNKLRARMYSARNERVIFFDGQRATMYLAPTSPDLCDHYAFGQGSYDWQIWIKAGSQPLPRKLVIINRADEARPQLVSLIEWNFKPAFMDDAFRLKAAS